VTGTRAAADPFELQGLLASLSGRDSAPAGGSAAAVVAAVAAAVVAKAARHSDNQGAATQALALAERLSKLAALDADVFAAALTALRQATERGELDAGASESRDFQLGRTLDEAAAAPFAIAEAAADVALLAAEVARAEGSELREDATCAALLAAGAARAAAHLVAINLASRPDVQAKARAALAAAAAAADSLER